ncbi:hypothetical protein G3567_04690 [Psychroflexus sp. YR1-1]|uniref:Uncharacterized protein n=1 Tax=Psychroflexus aurantiacus TaxID=2709310 RepID=A0A6B3R2Z7_9FLAO|nr:hypothetical protein [Psychroflexus aurantiacus]NEV93447.1 hypothetical protein [Psychroflexus aurantiacus]
MENKKKTAKDIELEKLKNIEKLEILQKAKETQGKQLTINIEDGGLKEIDELKELIDQKFDNPEEKHSLFYNGIQNLLKKYLPKGKEYAEQRKIIHEEKLIFLNRGVALKPDGTRGSDSRMTYAEDMNEMAKLISDWVLTSQDFVDLYLKLYELNEKYDYGHQINDDSSNPFFNRMNEK